MCKSRVCLEIDVGNLPCYLKPKTWYLCDATHRFGCTMHKKICKGTNLKPLPFIQPVEGYMLRDIMPLGPEEGGLNLDVRCL